MEKNDEKLTYSEQSYKFLDINNIKVTNKFPEIIISKKRLDLLNTNLYLEKNFKVAFCVDSSEEYKIWPEEYFFSLAEMLNKNNLGDVFFLISHPKNKFYVDKIISMSKKICFVDCSQINLLEMCNIILNSNFFVGNNSGPTTLASALNIKSYNLVSSTSVKELKFGKTIPIVPDDYVDPIDSTIKKIGDSFIKSRDQMKKITPQKVFNTIFNSYK